MIRLQHRVRLAGPLAPQGDGLWAHLLDRGYRPSTARELLRVLARLSRWMCDRGLTARGLTPKRVAEFVGGAREVGVAPILGHLRAAGVVPQADSPARDAGRLGQMLKEYEAFLARERNLVPGTIRWYCKVAREFLSPRAGLRGLGLGRLAAGDVTAFVLRESRTVSVSVAKLKVSALRAFLGYAFAEGLLRHDLRAAAPAIAGWRLAGLPKGLPPAVPGRLLRACDRRTAVGRRDFALLTLMLRLALRAVEVAALRLEDIDWARGELLVRGKGGREDRLPLPQDVGQALAAYLKCARPATTSRNVFIQMRAPHRDVTPDSVKAVVRMTAVKAGLKAFGSHRLRHTAATEMLRQGASLPQIAQALRHRSVETTAIYAKVDRAALRGLARPWPGSES